jgi:uncharacterized membrane protein YGL010W
MRSINSWLDEYASSHSNHTNKTVHFICVPLIFFTIVAFFYCVKLYTFAGSFTLTAAHVAIAFVAVYYLLLSVPLAIGMILYCCLCLLLCILLQDATQGNLVWVALSIFVTAWIFQFWGHSVEGKKPSFLKDIQFLMIGPAWVLNSFYKRFGMAV